MNKFSTMLSYSFVISTISFKYALRTAKVIEFTKSHKIREFSICTPRLWNNLPIEWPSCSSTDSFTKALKHHLF